jgi:hypothetical protein
MKIRTQDHLVRACGEVDRGKRPPRGNFAYGKDHLFEEINRCVEWILARIGRPAKNRKINPADIQQRSSWTQYRTACKKRPSATSPDYLSWQMALAHDKANARPIISRIVHAPAGIGMSCPGWMAGRTLDLQPIRDWLGT